MKTQDIFTNNNKEIPFYIYESFKGAFYDMEIEETNNELITRTLKHPMTDDEIIKEWEPEDITLGDLVHCIKNVGNKEKYYFSYIKDKSGSRRAVRWSWDGGGWSVDADVVPNPDGWLGCDEFVSRKPSSTLSPDSLTLSP